MLVLRLDFLLQLRLFFLLQFDNSYLIKTKFMHESFLENPWAELEKKLEEERNSKKIEEGEGASEQNTSGQKRTIDMID